MDYYGKVKQIKNKSNLIFVPCNYSIKWIKPVRNNICLNALNIYRQKLYLLCAYEINSAA